MAIREHLLSQGVINAEDPHTTISGIWAKLSSLYDLSKLDEREDSVTDISDDPAKGSAYFRDFELPHEDFEDLMWQKRLAPEGTQSPDWSRRGSTVADTDEPRSSPNPGGGSTRSSVRGAGTGRTTRRGGRSSRLQNEIETERSSRRTSKANSVADEDQTMDDAGDEDEEEPATGEEEESDEEEDAEPEEKKGGSTRGGRGGRRGRGRRGRRGR
jgi:MRG-binding protein